MKLSIVWTALATVACLVVGCGGGGIAPASSSPFPADPSANLKVTVVENDGQTSGLGAHVFRLVQTDETAVSTADGTLAFGPAPSGAVTLRLENETTLGLEARQGGAGEDLDPKDEEHADGAEVHVENVQAQERIEVRVHIRNGEMACVCVSRQLRGERDVEVAMLATDANDDADMQGELELEQDAHRRVFQVVVVDADTARELELVVVDTDGIEESQGVRLVDVLGEAVWRMDTDDGDLLPFAAVDLEELEGYGVEVRDADTGDALLTATVPQMPPFAGDVSGKACNRERNQSGEGEDAPHDDDANHGGDGHHGNDEDPGDEEPVIGHADLTALEEGLEGWVEIRSRDDWRLRVLPHGGDGSRAGTRGRVLHRRPGRIERPDLVPVSRRTHGERPGQGAPRTLHRAGRRASRRRATPSRTWSASRSRSATRTLTTCS